MLKQKDVVIQNRKNLEDVTPSAKTNYAVGFTLGSRETVSREAVSREEVKSIEPVCKR